MEKDKSKIKIGIVSDGKYGERAFENTKKHFDVEWILVPDIPPTVMLDDDIDLDIPECELYLSYVRHPDIILELAGLQKPLVLGITPGLGLLKQARNINPKVVGPRTMCSLEPNTGIPEIDTFAKYFGKPLFELNLDDETKVLNVKVLRSSPCGSSAAGANFMLNKKLSKENFQNYALTVCHECRAPRFGHTCDKEVSGIVHILSFIDCIDLEKRSMFDNELQEFIKNLNQEYKNKTEMKIF